MRLPRRFRGKENFQFPLRNDGYAIITDLWSLSHIIAASEWGFSYISSSNAVIVKSTVKTTTQHAMTTKFSTAEWSTCNHPWSLLSCQNEESLAIWCCCSYCAVIMTSTVTDNTWLLRHMQWHQIFPLRNYVHAVITSTVKNNTLYFRKAFFETYEAVSWQCFYLC